MKYLTIDDVCEMLSISRRTLERMRQGTAPDISERLLLINEAAPGSMTDDLLRRSKVTFPEPDFYIGKSPRWEQDKLIGWLKKNGSDL